MIDFFVGLSLGLIVAAFVWKRAKKKLRDEKGGGSR